MILLSPALLHSAEKQVSSEWKMVWLLLFQLSLDNSSASSCHTEGPQYSFFKIFSLPSVFTPFEVASNCLFISITPARHNVTVVWMSWPWLPSFPRLQAVTSQTSHLSGRNNFHIFIHTAQTIWKVILSNTQVMSCGLRLLTLSWKKGFFFANLHGKHPYTTGKGKIVSIFTTKRKSQGETSTALRLSWWTWLLQRFSLFSVLEHLFN